MGHRDDSHEPTSSGLITLYQITHRLILLCDRVSFVHDSDESSNKACNPKKEGGFTGRNGSLTHQDLAKILSNRTRF